MIFLQAWRDSGAASLLHNIAGEGHRRTPNTVWPLNVATRYRVKKSAKHLLSSISDSVKFDSYLIATRSLTAPHDDDLSPSTDVRFRGAVIIHIDLRAGG